jgi:thioesterase domain-containing protein/acyl carrier protein
MSAQNLEDVYELSPMQQYMFFNTLCKPASGLYVEQSVYALQGPLNISAFERAWQQLLKRHAVLRTAFFWEDLDKPLQVVLRQVPLPLDKQDWRTLSSIEQEARLDAYLETNRRRGFVISEAPLLRLALVRTAEHTYTFIQSFHHLLLDRWSVSLVLKELFAFYEAFCQGRDLRLPHSCPYGNYIFWLQQQDATEAEAFWRRNLEGFTSPITLVDHARTDGLGQTEVYDAQQARLSATATAALQSWAQQNHLALNTLVQGAWALILSRLTGKEDIVFGATFSGRPPGLEGVESMVGLFMNSLPVRVKVDRDETLLSWLPQLQNRMAELSQYEYSPLADVLGWSDVSGGQLLFESILVFENIPVDIVSLGRGREVHIRHMRSSGGRTNYPLTVTVVPGSDLSLRILYDCRSFDSAVIDRLLRHFRTLLEAIPNLDAEPLSRLLCLIDLGTRGPHGDAVASSDKRQPAPHKAGHRSPTDAGPHALEPPNNVERRLLEICREVLGIESVGATDDLLALGLQSLHAVRLFAEIEKRFGHSLPLTSLFRAPTIEGLTNLMNQPAPSNGSPSLVPIQPQGSQSPFFCVHEFFGDVFCYANLARHLGHDQPFYALEARGLDGAEEPFTDIATMAAHYIEVIRTVQPQGPYALGGLCFGGVVAFEMAQQLRLKGEAVSLVALLDSGVNSRRGRVAWWGSFLRNLPRDLPSWLIGAVQLNRFQWATLLRQKIRMTRASLRHAFRLSRNGSQQDGVPVRVQELWELSERHSKVARAQYWAINEYKPRVYPGRVTLFRARMQPFFSTHDPDKGWRQLAVGGVDIRVVPGNHLGMLQEPHVQILAKQLRVCLDSALTEVNGA